ncbi:MAG: hydrogenase 3 maturation endopeptidase HyCI [Candidatus Omnitrophota bacterium]
MNNTFKSILKGKVVIVGIGNTMKGDDGFGPNLIKRLKNNVKAVCIDTGTAPENYVGSIAKENPDTVLLVDAVCMDLAPGEYRILKPEEILKSGFTTHDISPTLFIEYLKKRTKAKIYMLGAEPQNMSLGDEMSGSIKRTLKEVAVLIKEACDA